MGESSKLFFHVSLFIIYIYSSYYQLKYIRDPNGHFFVNILVTKLLFLTLWSLVLQTVFFGYSIINDLFGSNLGPSHHAGKRSALQKFRDLFMAAIIFPIGAFVVLTFWGIYAVDRELVFPKRLDAIVPGWLNHVMHTTVILFLVIEKLFVYHRYPSRKLGISCIVGFAMLYQVWVLWIAYHAKIWVYPILAVLSWPGRIGFFAVCWVVMITLYLIGEKITTVVWSGKEVRKPTLKKME